MKTGKHQNEENMTTTQVSTAMDALSENIQSLGRFAQMVDFRRHTGEGFVGGLMEVYASQVRALAELRKALPTPSLARRLSVGDYLECLRQDLNTFHGAEAGLPGLFAGHIEGAERVARSLEQENAQLREVNAKLRATLQRERWEDVRREEAMAEMGYTRDPATRDPATRAWGIGATSYLGEDE